METDYENDHPLFWDKIPEDIAKDHPLMQALQNLEEEGTLEERANIRKEEGNKNFVRAKEEEAKLKTLKAVPKSKRSTEDNESIAKLKTLVRQKYDDALQQYDDALQQNCNNNELNSTVLSNRAAVHMARGTAIHLFRISILSGNYGKVIEDCTRSVNLHKNNIKAYWRAAKASFELEKYEDAIKFCTEGLKISFCAPTKLY